MTIKTDDNGNVTELEVRGLTVRRVRERWDVTDAEGHVLIKQLNSLEEVDEFTRDYRNAVDSGQTLDNARWGPIGVETKEEPPEDTAEEEKPLEFPNRHKERKEKNS